MHNDERKAIFAKNFKYLCRHLSGGTSFLAEKLLGKSRPTYWDQGPKVSTDDLLELRNVTKRLDRWCVEGVVRFDRRTRQDFTVLKEVFGLQSIEDFWRENLVSELEAVRTQMAQAAKEQDWAAEENKTDGRAWGMKVWQIYDWHTWQHNPQPHDLFLLIDKLWRAIPEQYLDQLPRNLPQPKTSP